VVDEICAIGLHQDLAGAGLPSGPADGLEICTNGDFQSGSTIVDAGGDGVIVAWEDYRNPTTATDIYAHKAFAAGLIFGNGFEGGDTGEWDAVFL
jgi:hypothetical protein